MATNRLPIKIRPGGPTVDGLLPTFNRTNRNAKVVKNSLELQLTVFNKIEWIEKFQIECNSLVMDSLYPVKFRYIFSIAFHGKNKNVLLDIAATACGSTKCEEVLSIHYISLSTYSIVLRNLDVVQLGRMPNGIRFSVPDLFTVDCQCCQFTTPNLFRGFSSTITIDVSKGTQSLNKK